MKDFFLKILLMIQALSTSIFFSLITHFFLLTEIAYWRKKSLQSGILALLNIFFFRESLYLILNVRNIKINMIYLQKCPNIIIEIYLFFFHDEKIRKIIPYINKISYGVNNKEA